MKALTGVAVELMEPKVIGRCRMAIFTDASAVTLHPNGTAHVESGV
jgi:hypothetical protein